MRLHQYCRIQNQSPSRINAVNTLDVDRSYNSAISHKFGLLIPMSKSSSNQTITAADNSVEPGTQSAAVELSSFSSKPSFSKWQEYVYKTVAAEISSFSRYYDQLIQLEPVNGDRGILFRYVENSVKSVAINIDSLLAQTSSSSRTIVLLNGNCNYELDIERLFCQIRPALSRESRLVVVGYNAYFLWLYKLANWLGIRSGPIPETFLTETDLDNIARLSGFEVVRTRNVAFCPWRLLGLGQVVNAVMAAIPLLRYLSLAEVVMLRPVVASTKKPSLTVLIPARNERGNIENALRRLSLPQDVDTEVIFVEGHSTDGTWDEIQRVMPLYRGRYEITAYTQQGKGKADAVRLGFAKATKDLLVILDADLSMPPELLERFYSAYCSGVADFINGSRLLYPIEGQAMKFLNKLGNIFFAKTLSHILGVRLSDTLCGTKLLSRDSYERFVKWRTDFGDFDPFGDFELLFPAAVLGLGIIDVPIRYRDRLYGETNISRFRHGFMLLKMTMIGWLRITLGRTAGKP